MARPMMKPGWVQAITAWLAATESYDSGLRVQKYMAGEPSAPTASGRSTRRASAPGNTVIDGLGRRRRRGPGTSGIDGEWRMRSGSTVLSSTRPRDSSRSPW